MNRGYPPQLPLCHLCHRQYGTSSLPIHLKACRARWEREHGRPPPEPRTSWDAPISSGASLDGPAEYSIDEFGLQACRHCARTFLPDRLLVHMRSCGPWAVRRAPRTCMAAAKQPAAGDLPPSLSTVAPHHLDHRPKTIASKVGVKQRNPRFVVLCIDSRAGSDQLPDRSCVSVRRSRVQRRTSKVVTDVGI